MDADALVSGFCKRSVLVVGDVMVDKFVFGRVSRISPEAPVPVIDVVMESDIPGGAANVVSILAMTGARVFVSGVVGDDDSGRGLVGKLGALGVDVKGVVVDGKRPTTVKTRIVAHNQQVARVDRESKEGIDSVCERRILKYFSGVVGGVDGVVISDYCKGTVTFSLAGGLVSAARRSGKMVVVNAKADSISFFRDVDVVLVGLDEASAASGIKAVNETSVRNMGNKILSMLGCSSVVITRGKTGFMVFEGNGSVSNVRAPDFKGVYEFKKTDDTALSFLALGLFSGLGVVDAARFSSYVVELLASKTTASKLTLEDIREALSSRPFS
jgi:D-beta-D-heptose 7-phosphate kinase/D-beta-D-heptose 1-phosphate adenosyltransferase